MRACQHGFMHEMLAEEIVDKYEASTNSGGQHQKPGTGQFVEQGGGGLQRRQLANHAAASMLPKLSRLHCDQQALKHRERQNREADDRCRDMREDARRQVAHGATGIRGKGRHENRERCQRKSTINSVCSGRTMRATTLMSPMLRNIKEATR
ncbi:MAG: hypothetical protein CM15mP74_33460 [Halieaceae bacterium]|nr:MAG: hypothetical protein CM15mP74_33460 [Halieaceae bacterium]